MLSTRLRIDERTLEEMLIDVCFECMHLQVFCALFATGGVVGLGFTVDIHHSYQDGFGSDLKKFFRSVDASCALLLAAVVCMVIMVMISVYSK